MDGQEGIALGQGVSVMLTNIALGYLSSLGNGYIARQVFPNVPVPRPTGLYNILRRGAFLRLGSKVLDNKEPTPIKSFGYDKNTYSVDHWGVAADWTDLDLAGADVGGIGAAQHINNKVLMVTLDPVLRLEVETATLIRNVGNWSNVRVGVANYTGAANTFLQWGDAASTPIENVDQWIEDFTLTCGFTPNMMIMPRQVWKILKNNPEIVARIRYDASQSANAPVQVTLATLQNLFGIDKILVPGGVLNSAPEGQPDQIGYIWGKDCWMGYVQDAPSRDNPSAGYFFSWTGQTGQSPAQGGAQPNNDGLFIRRYFQERPRTYFVESEWFTTPQVTGSDLGLLIQTAVIP